MNYNIVVPTIYGQMILNRNDTWQTLPAIQTGQTHVHEDVVFLCRLAQMCGEGTVCMDIGANFGYFGLTLAQTLKPLNGEVWAIEAQRIVSYALTGTVALNGLENMYVHNWAMGKENGTLLIPQYDYSKKGSFGSVEFKTVIRNDVAQDRLPDNPKEVVPMVTLDSLNLERLDLIKVDVEGMELDVLEGGINTLAKFKPLAWVEWFKSDRTILTQFFADLGYNVYEHGIDLFCIRPDQFPELQATMQDWLKLHIQP